MEKTKYYSKETNEINGKRSKSRDNVKSRYKTELCRPFEENGSCKYAEKCQFAHGKHELRNLVRHPKYKTDLCKTYHTTGLCPYGPRCHFIHNDSERNVSNKIFTELAQKCIAKQSFSFNNHQLNSFLFKKQFSQTQQLSSSNYTAANTRQEQNIINTETADYETMSRQLLPYLLSGSPGLNTSSSLNRTNLQISPLTLCNLLNKPFSGTYNQTESFETLSGNKNLDEILQNNLMGAKLKSFLQSVYMT